MQNKFISYKKISGKKIYVQSHTTKDETSTKDIAQQWLSVGIIKGTNASIYRQNIAFHKALNVKVDS